MLEPNSCSRKEGCQLPSSAKQALRGVESRVGHPDLPDKVARLRTRGAGLGAEGGTLSLAAPALPAPRRFREQQCLSHSRLRDTAPRFPLRPVKSRPQGCNQLAIALGFAARRRLHTEARLAVSTIDQGAVQSRRRLCVCVCAHCGRRCTPSESTRARLGYYPSGARTWPWSGSELSRLVTTKPVSGRWAAPPRPTLTRARLVHWSGRVPPLFNRPIRRLRTTGAFSAPPAGAPG